MTATIERSFNAIPPMTHPLGKHWRQPKDIREAPMDSKFVLLSVDQFRRLSDYSASIPTGAYEGKCWKARRKGHWYLVWYAYGDSKNVNILNRRIMIGRLKPRQLPPYPEH